MGGGGLKMFEKHRELLLQSLDAAHAAYYRAETFGGPSLHFHLRALEAGRAADFDKFVENVYAVLVAWGMHRMGRGGSKMCEFEQFKASLEPLWPTIVKLQRATPEDLDEVGWEQMGTVFRGIRCMATRTSLVANSKVMAHALPSLIVPVDRQYTIRFLFGTTNIVNDVEREWEKLKIILREFFYPLLRTETFKLKLAAWQSSDVQFSWDTSPLKILDNLIIGLLKAE